MHPVVSSITILSLFVNLVHLLTTSSSPSQVPGALFLTSVTISDRIIGGGLTFSMFVCHLTF
jgi:hypothetical protein